MPLSQADLDLIRRVEKEHGIVLFKGPEYDPDRYGMVRPEGEEFFLKSDTKHEIRRVRGVMRDFRGPAWSSGLPVGVTHKYQKKYGESADADQRVYLGVDMDIAFTEQQALKVLALKKKPLSKEQRDERTRVRDELRQKASEDALTPHTALAETIAKAIQGAVAPKAPAEDVLPARKRKAETPEEMLQP